MKGPGLVYDSRQSARHNVWVSVFIIGVDGLAGVISHNVAHLNGHSTIHSYRKRQIGQEANDCKTYSVKGLGLGVCVQNLVYEIP